MRERRECQKKNLVHLHSTIAHTATERAARALQTVKSHAVQQYTRLKFVTGQEKTYKRLRAAGAERETSLWSTNGRRSTDGAWLSTDTREPLADGSHSMGTVSGAVL